MAAESARVWGRHEYTDPEGRLVTCRIQDVTPDLHDKLIHYYTTQFINDEAISKNLKMSEDEVSVVEYTNLLREAMAGGHCLVVLEDCAARPDPEVVAAGMYVVAARGDQSLLQGQGRSFRVIMAVFDALKKLPGCDPLERVPRYMTGMGMWVRRDRRRRGLAEAVVRAALASCRGRGIPHFSAVYTGIGSQRAATKAGLQEMGSVAYEGFLDENGKPAFDANMTEKFCKLLATDIDIND